MPEFTVHYFGLYARAEPTRMVLAHAGADWHDNRISNWPEVKASMPNGQVPVLELADGTVMGQSLAILRFVGMKFGYMPTDAMEAFHVNYLVDRFQDIGGLYYKPVFAAEDAKEALYTQIFDDALPKFLAEIDHYCAKGSWLVGDKLSIADFTIGGFYANTFKNPACYTPERWAALAEKFPNFHAYGERFVAENEKYLSSRPSAAV